MINANPTVSPSFEAMVQTPVLSSRRLFFSSNPNPITALDDEDSLVHDFDHISIHSSTDADSFCLFFKLLSPKSAKPSWIEKAMSEAWTLRFPCQISEYHSGLFLASFQCDGDRRRVLEEQPWHFDNFLMVFTHPDVSPTPTPESIRYVPFWIQVHRIPFGRKSPQLAQFIADEIGDLLEIYPLSLMENFGPYLRIRVLLDITKPLRKDLQQAVDQFLHVDSPQSSPNPRISTQSPYPASSFSPLPATQTTSGHAVPSFSIPFSAPIITDSISISTHTDKGKGKASMISPPTNPPRSRGDKGIVINESCPPPIAATSPVVRPTFMRHATQVGDSMRSMLKRARAIASDDALVPSMSDDEPTAGAATRPAENNESLQLECSRFYGSDHRALKIMFQDPNFTNLRSNRFHFENHWLKDPSFTNLLNSSWVNPQGLSSSPLQLFLHKQSHCISEIRTWSKSQHPIRLQISRTQADLNNLLNDSQLTPNSLSQVATLQSRLDGLLLKEEVYWKQRSRVDWLCGVCDMAVNSLLQGITNRLSTHQVAFLAEPYTEAEVKQALFSLSGDKALGPDGLNSLFYKRRQITDNILLANEIIHAINSRRSGKVGWAAIKLDMEKAFDRVKWSFLNRLLAHVGFPPSFSSLIMRCLSTVQFWLSINGSLTDTFHSTRGIRQGDPLSPYLFLLIAEGLSAAIRLQETNAHFSGIQICRGAQPLSHLLFAEDSMVFSQVHSRASDSLNVILDLYNKATGQLVNRDKSSILFSHNTSADAQLQFRQSLQLHGEGFISKYLGVPHCVGRVSNSMFHYLLQKVSSRLNSWNEKFFSRAGKETLIKAVVQAIPSFAMSCFKVPKLICQKIQSLIAKFWWGSQGTKKIHWENWDVISVSKFFGGLGFRILSSHNQALLAKQAWRIWNDRNSLLHSVLKARAKSIWKSSRFKQFYLAYHRSDIKDFLIQPLHNISKQDFPIFITFVWQIWNSRNSILFNKSGVTNNVEEIVVNYLQDYSAAQCKHQDDNLHSEATHTPPASQHQHPPSLSPETPSLFVDAAIDQQNGITGTGFIFKHGFQAVLASHYHQLPGAVSPIFAEGQALLQSLKWCIDSQFSPQIVFSDCLNLVSKVNGAWQDNSALSGLVSQIRLLFSNFPGASLQFLPRQFNMDAHVLAREALRSREVH
uniref:Reverse transcriptase domain-containing protein n=1 Tax=Cannabis sativa TaxID=3483 RepID=A0A803PZ74_CANSA